MTIFLSCSCHCAVINHHVLLTMSARHVCLSASQDYHSHIILCGYYFSFLKLASHSGSPFSVTCSRKPQGSYQMGLLFEHSLCQRTTCRVGSKCHVLTVLPHLKYVSARFIKMPLLVVHPISHVHTMRMLYV